jgi:hypothetical protein
MIVSANDKYNLVWYPQSGEQFDWFIVEGNPMKDEAVAAAKDEKTATLIMDSLSNKETL